MFGTLIALLHNGQPVLGVIDQPVTRERWVGVAGAPSTLNGRPIATRECGDIGNAYMYATTPHMFEGATEQVGASRQLLGGGTISFFWVLARARGGGGGYCLRGVQAPVVIFWHA